MRSQKIRLKPTKEQESLMWWYSKVSRNYWNLLVDIDKRNNQGEFDEILSNNGNQTYYSKYYDREIYNLNQADYLNLAKVVVTKNSKVDKEGWSWYYQPNQTFIYSFIARELVKIRRQNKGKLVLLEKILTCLVRNKLQLFPLMGNIGTCRTLKMLKLKS